MFKLGFHNPNQAPIGTSCRKKGQTQVHARMFLMDPSLSLGSTCPIELLLTLRIVQLKHHRKKIKLNASSSFGSLVSPPIELFLVPKVAWHNNHKKKKKKKTQA
jgi:hypothetical protein